MSVYRAHGKLLLFGEYFVLDGCRAIAWPTRFGQELHTHKEEVQVKGLYWKSLNHKREIWFEAYFDENLGLLHGLNDDVSLSLQKILLSARAINPGFLKDGLYHEAVIRSDYPAEWGLGSSSTLIHLIAQWAGINAMELFFRSFQGSGYDIACAGANGPILYRLAAEQKPIWSELFIPRELLDSAVFVYLGKKQNSREGIALYHSKQKSAALALPLLDEAIDAWVLNPDRKGLTELMAFSEKHISETLGLPTAGGTLFADYPGKVKSLGAWGGDFVMAIPADPGFDSLHYFREKGYDTVLQPDTLLL